MDDPSVPWRCPCCRSPALRSSGTRPRGVDRPHADPGATAEETIGRLLKETNCRVPASAFVAHARRVVERAAASGLTALSFADSAYPALLARLSDAPAVLWARGSVAVLGRPAVAVVGSRAASPAGIAGGRLLAEDLAAAGLVVVSGLARGVDAAAHAGALTVGTTVAVLGSGADVVYPAAHATLAAGIAGSGAVVSEFPPGTAPRRHHFPLRNRIISGLCLAVVVVEAAERSGALITARTALDQGREVMAMPGPIAGGRNRGAHGLIRDGALLVETAEDVLSALRRNRACHCGRPTSPPTETTRSCGSSRRARSWSWTPWCADGLDGPRRDGPVSRSWRLRDGCSGFREVESFASRENGNVGRLPGHAADIS